MENVEKLQKKYKRRGKSSRNGEKDITSFMDVFADEKREIQQELAAGEYAEITKDRDAKEGRAKEIRKARKQDQNRLDRGAENSRA